MMDKVEIQSKKLIFNDFFKIYEAIIRYLRFDGQMSKPVRRLVFERGDAVAAIIWNRDTQKVILTNQFRYPTYEKGPGWIYEVIAGMLTSNEQPEEAMRREMIEETGYQPGQLTHIATFYVSPGGTSERIMLYYAEISNADKIAAGGGLASENEDIQLIELSPSELWNKLDNGTIADAKTIIGAMWLHRKLEGK
jgi:nudix-type nucleoside diphosphatase (YffH/AdpP family)